jgi:hypothetical protein
VEYDSTHIDQPFFNTKRIKMSSRMRAAIICPARHMRCDRQPSQRAQRRQRANTTRALSTCHGHALPSPSKIYIDTYVAAGLILCVFDVSCQFHHHEHALTQPSERAGQGARAASHRGKLDITRANHFLMPLVKRYPFLIATAFCSVTLPFCLHRVCLCTLYMPQNLSSMRVCLKSSQTQ